jgi:peptide/nickel transport system ATP-binding protein
MSTAEPVLVAEDLHRKYRRRKAQGSRPTEVAAVNGVSLRLGRGEAIGIVGESGSGKSTLARLLLALEKPDRGVVRFDGHPISQLPEARVRPMRRRFQAVFQDPSTSLDPCLRVGTIVAEPLVAHSIGTTSERRERVAELLDQVGLPPTSAEKHPREFSGGERQRIAIARALSTDPRLLILDEPTSSLDVSVQAQILDLMVDLRQANELALVWISHDLDVVRDVCEGIAVMHEGGFVEAGPTARVLDGPEHPYTQALLEAAPQREVKS